MVYKWKEMARIRVSADVAGRVCEELEKDGALTPKHLLDVSRAEDAPLHDAFEWNDGIAAEKYRESQAGYIIRSLVIEKGEDVKKEPVRAFFKVSESNPTYESIGAIVQKPDAYAELLKMAKRDAEAFMNRYKSITELAPVFSAISEFCASA